MDVRTARLTTQKPNASSRGYWQHGGIKMNRWGPTGDWTQGNRDPCGYMKPSEREEITGSTTSWSRCFTWTTVPLAMTICCQSSSLITVGKRWESSWGYSLFRYVLQLALKGYDKSELTLATTCCHRHHRRLASQFIWLEGSSVFKLSLLQKHNAHRAPLSLETITNSHPWLAQTLSVWLGLKCGSIMMWYVIITGYIVYFCVFFKWSITCICKCAIHSPVCTQL